MARTQTKAPAKRRTTPKTSKQVNEDQQVPTITIGGINADEIIGYLDEQVNKSKGFWDGKEYNLEKATKDNEALYLGTNVTARDDGSGDQDISLDNRIFADIRTMIPYVTTRITEPEVYPSSNSEEAKKFAEDLEKALYIKAKKEKLRKKVRHALEDAIVRRRGYLKPRYDATTKNFCAIEYVPCEAIIIDHNVKSTEEPRYFRHCIKRSVSDLEMMFPEQKAKIRRVFKIEDNAKLAELEEPRDVNEDWFFRVVNGEQDLFVAWSHKKEVFGVIQDPNWLYDGENFLDNHMMPLVFFNILNDGRKHIDKTSFVEQTKYLQDTVNKRGEQISKNADLGSVGMPVVDAAAIPEDQAQFLTYDKDTVLELDVDNAGKQSINDVFTTWQARPLPNNIYDDKLDARAAIDNTFGVSNVMRGESTANTLGQDELLRDTSMGRQQEIVDAIDDAMGRLYPLMAQMLLVYGEEEELFRIVGEDANFDYLLMHTAELDTSAEIQVRGGTSMPIDNPQRRATADRAAAQGLLDPLSYWEIMDQPNAEKYAKRLMDFKADPAGFLKDMSDNLFNRDAYVDIQLIKQGKQPPYRNDLTLQYFDYLNKYALSGDLENPEIPIVIRQNVTAFINQQLERGQKMLGMAETQLPTPQDVQAHNATVDQANAQGGPAQANAAPQGPPQPTPQDMGAPAPAPAA
jgi:hypothetical protein